MNDKNKNIAIGIVSFERPLMTQRCIDSIRETTKIPYHIYIADNGSKTEKTKTRLRIWEKQPDITLICMDKNYGPSAGRNKILEKVIGRHDIVAMLDNDCIVLEGWDNAAVEALNAGYGVVCPKLLNADMKTVQRGPTRAWPGGWLIHPEYIGRGYHRYAPEVNVKLPIEIFPGTAIFLSRVFDLVGKYDDRLWVGEDYDLAYRAASINIRVCYEPKCEIVHDHAFDIEYDKVRIDPKRSLISHIVLLEKHKRLLLPPSSLRLFFFLEKNVLPMWTSQQKTFKNTFSRIFRRIVNEYFRHRYGEVWYSYEEGEKATKKIMLHFGINV